MPAKMPAMMPAKGQTDKLLLTFRIHTASDADAAQLFPGLSDAFQKKYPNRTNSAAGSSFLSFETDTGGVFLRCNASDCVSLEGADLSLFDKLTHSIGWGHRPPTRPIETAVPKIAIECPGEPHPAAASAVTPGNTQYLHRCRYAFRPLGTIGSARRRFPVAWAIALPMAGAMAIKRHFSGSCGHDVTPVHQYSFCLRHVLKTRHAIFRKLGIQDAAVFELNRFE